MGGLAGLTGPAPTLWCLLRGWDRDAQRAMFQAFNLAMHSLIIPTLAGVRVYQRFSHHDFQRLVLFLLVASGLMMLLALVLHPDPIPSQR